MKLTVSKTENAQVSVTKEGLISQIRRTIGFSNRRVDNSRFLYKERTPSGEVYQDQCSATLLQAEKQQLLDLLDKHLPHD
jgi:hypothetical protein